MNLDDHVGKQLVVIDILASCSPTFEFITEPTVNASELIQKLQQELRDTIERMCGPVNWFLEPLSIELHSRSGIIEPKDVRKKKHKELMESLMNDGTKERSEQIRKQLENDPHNGRKGWWNVVGIRHECYVKTDSALAAIDRAIKEGRVGEWEHPIATFVGEELPEVF